MEPVASILENNPSKQKKPRTTPTFKQAEFAKAYIKHKGNGTQAALEVYDGDYENAKAIAHENLQKPIVLEEIENVRKSLTDKGITLDWLAQQAQDSINNGIGVKATQKDANDMIKFMYKLHNALPGTKNTTMKINLKGNLADLAIPEVIATLKTTQTKTNELIEDIS